MNRTLPFLAAILGLVGVVTPLPAQAPSAPLTLEDCLRLALEHNPQLVSSAQNIAVARAGVRQARSSYAPQLTLKATTGVSGSSADNLSDGHGASLILGMTFWRSGRHDTVSQSRANLQAATSSHADQRLTLAKVVADDYYAVLTATELVGVAQMGVEAAEQHREQVRRQIAEGSVAAVEIHTVEDDLAQARLSLIDARSTMQKAMAVLQTDMGLPAADALRLAPAVIGAEEAPPTEEEAVATAFARRPDLQAQMAVVQARRHAVAVARSNRGPILEVGGQAAQEQVDWSDGRSSWDLTAGLTWSLADGGYAAAGVSAAQANLLSSEADLQALRNQAILEVRSALIELARSAEQIVASEEAVTAASARLRGAEVKYREGLGILVEVTDARQSLTSAEAERVRARFAYQVARTALKRATGTLPLPPVGAEVQP